MHGLEVKGSFHCMCYEFPFAYELRVTFYMKGTTCDLLYKLRVTGTTVCWKIIFLYTFIVDSFLIWKIYWSKNNFNWVKQALIQNQLNFLYDSNLGNTFLNLEDFLMHEKWLEN